MTSATRVAIFLALIFAIRAVQAADATGPAWQDLFDGQSLAGWKASEKPGSFKVVDGVIVCDGPRSHLFYVGPSGDAAFTEFEFEAEVLTKPGANSGIYFHTGFQDRDWPTQGYEVQVNNTATGEGGYRENKKTGSLYGIRNVHRQLVPDDQWFTLRIVVRGKRVAIHVNDVQTVDYTEPVNPPNGGYKDRRLARGTFALQCHDAGSRALFRKLRVRVLPTGPMVPAPDPGASPALAALHANNFPVVDFNLQLQNARDGLDLKKVLERQFRTGINSGVLVDGRFGGTPAHVDSAERGLREIRGTPVCFAGLWVDGNGTAPGFPAATVAKFDYVIADAGLVEDATAGDPVERQEFMDRLVTRTVAMLESRLINIWARPLRLPEAWKAEAAVLWTRPRMRLLAEAAAKSGVAIEINERERLPGSDFVHLAKKAGTKFVVGATDGRLEYGAMIVGECGLKWQDFWVPAGQSLR